MSEIVVLGGINMDLVVRVPHVPRPGETVQGGGVQRFSGGKGANQAVAAARLGASVALIGQVGADAFGEELLAGLDGEAVAVSCVRRLPDHPTGVALISVADDGQNAIVVAPGANMIWDDVATSWVEAALSGCRVLVANLEVPSAIVARAISVARQQGVQVILNPAPWRRGDEHLLRAADLVVPNQVEAAQALGLDPERVTDWTAIGKQLAESTGARVVLTLGADGALLVRHTEVTRVPPFSVAVEDTTAAGDAFVGGLAVAVLQGRGLPEAVRFANACGALAVTQAGAQPSLPDRLAVERLLAGSD